MKLRFLFEPRDLWIGAYWDSHKRRLYILPVPCLGIVLDFDPLPKLNTRRIALLDKKWKQTWIIDKKLQGTGLTEAESAELTDLNNKVFKILEARYPRPTDDLEAQLRRLDDIETRIKKSRETP